MTMFVYCRGVMKMPAKFFVPRRVFGDGAVVFFLRPWCIPLLDNPAKV